MNEVVRVITEYWFYWSVPLIFLVIVVWIYRPAAKRRYRTDGSIPFDKDGDEKQADLRGQ
jgi:cbb3-type cytochrome oxidase subunit 3